MTEPSRSRLLKEVKLAGKVSDIKSLLRVLFGPDLDICQTEGTTHYLKLMNYWFTYLRPRGALHPADLGSPHAVALREALGLLRERLSFLSDARFRFRLDMCAMLVVSAFIGYDFDSSRETSESFQLLTEDALEMAAAAMCVAAPEAR